MTLFIIEETTCIPKTLYEKLMKAFRQNEENSQRDYNLDYTFQRSHNLDYPLPEDGIAPEEMAEPDHYKYVMKTL